MHGSSTLSTARHRPGTSRHRTARIIGVLLFALALALTGCSASDGDNDKAAGDGGARRGAAPAAGDQEAGPGGDRAGGRQSDARAKKPPKLTGTRIIRTARLTVRVKDVPDALDKARATVTDAGGFVGDESTDRDGKGRERSRVVLRVPQEKYERVLADLQGTGRLIDRSATAKDVTDQVVDVESRITSQRASVARVRELMDEATKLSDVVSLEGELSSRQSDLEALLAQRASLKDRTSMATITLSLTEAPAARADGGDDAPGFVDAVSGGWDAFVTMLRWVAVVLGAVLPFLAVAALLVAAWLRLVRPRLPRRAANQGRSVDT